MFDQVELQGIKAWFQQPIMFFLRFSVKNQIFIALSIFFILFIMIPTVRYIFNKICTFFDPVRFSFQHVMIIGGSDGLGKELVREVFMKGALVTIIGRSEK